MRLNVGSLQREEDVELRVRARVIRSGWSGCLVRLFEALDAYLAPRRGRARKADAPRHGGHHITGRVVTKAAE